MKVTGIFENFAKRRSTPAIPWPRQDKAPRWPTVQSAISVPFGQSRATPKVKAPHIRGTEMAAHIVRGKGKGTTNHQRVIADDAADPMSTSQPQPMATSTRNGPYWHR